jgi:hypothetical protein
MNAIFAKDTHTEIKSKIAVRAAIYAGVILGTKKLKPDNTGFCLFNPKMNTHLFNQ